MTPTNNITLHSKGLEIDKSNVRLKDISSKAGKAIKDLKISFNTEHDFLIITFDQTLTEDHRYEIYIPFRGKLDDSLAGMHKIISIPLVNESIRLRLFKDFIEAATQMLNPKKRSGWV